MTQPPTNPAIKGFYLPSEGMLIIIREGGRSFLEDLGGRGPTWVSKLQLDFMPNVCFVDLGSSSYSRSLVEM